MENISQTQKILKNKSEVLPDLEDAYQDALRRFKEAEKARDLKYKADDLKKELAWAHVASKEQARGRSLCCAAPRLITFATGTH